MPGRTRGSGISTRIVNWQLRRGKRANANCQQNGCLSAHANSSLAEMNENLPESLKMRLIRVALYPSVCGFRSLPEKVFDAGAVFLRNEFISEPEHVVVIRPLIAVGPIAAIHQS